jgi:hypothetical protein
MWVDHTSRDRIMAWFFSNQALVSVSMVAKLAIMSRFSSTSNVALTNFFFDLNFFGSWTGIDLLKLMFCFLYLKVFYNINEV